MSVATVVLRGFGPDATIAFIVTAGFGIGTAPPTPVVVTESIVTQGGTPIAQRNINVLQEQLGQRDNSGTLRSHSSGKSGPLLGTRRRLGQS